MSSIIGKEIPQTISKTVTPEYVTISRFNSEINFEVNQIYHQIDDLIKTINAQNKRIKDLESNRPQNKVSPGHRRVDTLFGTVKIKGSVRTKQVRQMFGLKQQHQAIRIMKSTARQYPENVYFYQSKKGKKECSLNMKKKDWGT